MNQRISREELLMKTAFLVAERSTCNRLHVGAVAAIQGRSVVSGYNGAPAGIDHCMHQEDEGECIWATHAEANAIAFAARHGVSLLGSTLFTTHSPCIRCAHLIINAGIEEVYYSISYRDDSGLRLLHNAKLTCTLFPMDRP